MSTSAATALAKKRARRQKQILAVGTVVLLAVLGFQLPKLRGGHGAQAIAPVGTTTSSLPVASPLASAGALHDTDRIEVEHDTSQLLAFGLFKSKDPFVQQLSPTAAAAPIPTPAAPAAIVPAPSKSASAGGEAPSGTPAQSSTAPPAPSVITTPVISPATPAAPVPLTPAPTPTPAAPPPEPASVPISTNGVCEQVALKGTFPATENTFLLVEIAKNGKSVKIAIAGGSYDSGQATATVKLGEKLTLVNTSDDSRYVIVLEAKCAATSGKTTAASTPLVTPAAAAPAAPSPTTTTPIVTDPYDTAPPPTG
jgi:hypothetical protein